MRGLSSPRFSEDNESEPCAGRIPANLPELPHHVGLATRDVRPQYIHEISANRGPRDCRLRPVPRERPVCRHTHRLCFVPHERFPGDDKSQSRPGRNPNHLRYLPHHDVVGKCHIRSQQDRLPADRYSRDHSLFPVPRQRKLQPDQYHLRVVPPDELPGDDQSQSRAGRIPTNLRELPQHGLMDECHFRPQQDWFPAQWRPRSTAMFTMPHQRKLQPDQHHLRLVSPEGLPGNDRSQSSCRPGCRRLARVATPPRHGEAPLSTTQPPASR